MKNVIRGKVAYEGISEVSLLRKTGLKHTRYYAILRKPETLRVDEFMQLDKVLHFTEDEVRELLGRS